MQGHVDEVVRTSVEETLNTMLEAEADQLCQTQRDERSPNRAEREPVTTTGSGPPVRMMIRMIRFPCWLSGLGAGRARDLGEKFPPNFFGVWGDYSVSTA